MIPNQQILNVQTNNIKTREFGITINRSMFRILSNQIYSNPKKAIIRELATNAWDSHVAANKENIPFEIHLPNMLEDWYSITDFGVGISEENIYALYTQYGSSDKIKSDKFCGMLGLGSKSPFSYTDSFVIESIFDKVKTTYTCFLSSEGVPSISEPMTKEKVDSCNGFTVKFPVKHQDFSNFAQEAKEVLQWFKVKPIVSGSSSFTFPTEKQFLRKTSIYSVYKNSTQGYSYVIMGNVAYPINIRMITTASAYRSHYSGYGTNYNNSSTEDLVAQLLQWGVELYVNIGDVEITASRESLSYSSEEGGKTKTADFIKNLCKVAIADLQTELVKDIANEPNIWKARQKLHSLRTSFLGGNLTATWQGKNISSNIDLMGSPTKLEKWSRGYASYRNPSKLRLSIRELKSIDADSKPIYWSDSHGGEASLRYFFELNSSLTECYLFTDVTETWLKEQGLDSVVVKTSTLAKKPRVTGVRASAEKAKIYQYTSASGAPVNWWKPAEIDLTDTSEFIYAKILYFRYYIGESAREPNSLDQTSKIIEELVGKKIPIYGIRPSDEPIIKKSKGVWIKLEDYLKRIKDNNKLTLEPLVAKRDYFLNLPNRDHIIKFEPTKFDSNSEFGKVVSKSIDGKKASINAKVNKMIELYNMTGENFQHNTTESGDDLIKIQDKYPLLRYVYWYNAQESTFRDGVYGYVGGVDKGVI